MPAQRDNVGQLLFGGPAPLADSPPRHTKADYAAELRAQIAAKEAARQAEREHSLRQSAAHLALRQAAPSAVLPMPARHPEPPLQPVGSVRSGANGFMKPTTQQPPGGMQQRNEEAPWQPMPPMPLRAAAQPAAPQYGWEDEPPSRWHAAEHHSMPPPAHPAPGGLWWHEAEQQARHSTALPSEPPSAAGMPGASLGGWQEPQLPGHLGWQEPPPAAARGWMDEDPPAPLPPVRQPPQQQAGPTTRSSMPSLDPCPPFLPGPHAAGPVRPALPPNYGAVASVAPFGNDLQPPQQPPIRSRSLRLPPGAADPALPPWGVSQPGAAPAQSMGSSSRPAAAGRLAAIGAEQLDGQAARQAHDAKRAAYKAELEAQMAAKEERRRQEREQERAEERRKAQEAAQLLQKAAGGYGGGSGPLRGMDGRPITDLNQVRRFQEGRSQPGSPAAGSPVQAGAGIQAYWGSGSAAAAAAGFEPEHPHAAAGMAPVHGPAQAALWQDPPPVHGGWEDAAPRPPAAMPLPAAPAATAYSSPTKPSFHGKAHAGVATGVMAADAEQPTLRLRSDRPFQTASEAERRKREQAEFQEALRQQVEEKARLRAEEQQRRKAEEAEEEARLAREQERLRQQFAADQARQRAKQADKEAAGTETLESGGVTIKFKPPPAQRRQGAAAQAQASAAAMKGIDPDDAVSGVEIRMPRRPPPRQASGAREAAPIGREAAVAKEPVDPTGSSTAGLGAAAEQGPAPAHPGSDSLSRAPSGVPPPWQHQQQQPPGMRPYSGVPGAVQPPWGMPAMQVPNPGWGLGMPPPPMQQHGPLEWAGPPPPAPWTMAPAFAAPPQHWLPPHMAAAGGPPAGPPWMHHPPATASAGYGMPPLPPPATAGYGMPLPPTQHPWAAAPAAFGPGPGVPGMPGMSGMPGVPTVTVLPPNRPFMGPVFETTSVLAAGLNGSRQVLHVHTTVLRSLAAG